MLPVRKRCVAFQIGFHKRIFAVLSRKRHASNSEIEGCLLKARTPTCRSCPNMIIGAGVSENKTWELTLQGGVLGSVILLSLPFP